MERERAGFYRRTLERLLADGVVERGMAVLVVAGGELDRSVLAGLGFEDVTVTNLGDEADVRADAEDMPFADESFDVALVSAGLHHCASPHRALLELYRVARRAVVALEARDSLVMRLAARLGVVDEYELTAVAANDFRSGGVRDTPVPNYVYRWTEREIEKTIAAWAPWARHRFVWFHELEIPFSVVDMRRGPSRVLARAAAPALRALVRVTPGQANLFAFAVLKPDLRRDLQPWIRLEHGRPAPDEAWIRRRYSSSA